MATPAKKVKHNECPMCEDEFRQNSDLDGQVPYDTIQQLQGVEQDNYTDDEVVGKNGVFAGRCGFHPLEGADDGDNAVTPICMNDVNEDQDQQTQLVPDIDSTNDDSDYIAIPTPSSVESFPSEEEFQTERSSCFPEQTVPNWIPEE